MMKYRIVIEKVSKRYSKSTIFKNVDMTLDNDKIYSIRGFDGSGKATLLNIISGVENEYTGEVKYSKDLKFGYILPEAGLLDFLTIRDNLLLISDDENEIKKLSNDLNVNGLLDKLPGQLNEFAKQRISIVRSLLINPDVLLFDEPTKNLDRNNSIQLAKFINKLRKYHKLIIIASCKDIYDNMVDEVYEIKEERIKLIKQNDIKEITELAELTNPVTPSRMNDYACGIKKALSEFQHLHLTNSVLVIFFSVLALNFFIAKKSLFAYEVMLVQLIVLSISTMIKAKKTNEDLHARQKFFGYLSLFDVSRDRIKEIIITEYMFTATLAFGIAFVLALIFGLILRFDFYFSVLGSLILYLLIICYNDIVLSGPLKLLLSKSTKEKLLNR